MKYIKVTLAIIIVMIIAFSITNVYCTQAQGAGAGGSYTNTGFFNDIIGEGQDFFNTSGNDETGIGIAISNLIENDIMPIIVTVGNFIFFAVAAFLGIKYIWSGVEGRSKVKETLPTFVVAASVFYLASSVNTLVKGLAIDVTAGNNFTEMETTLWGNISYVVNILAIAGIAALGLKYMFASADTKADIKKDLIPVAIGLVFIFSVSNVLNLIVDAGKEVF